MMCKKHYNKCDILLQQHNLIKYLEKSNLTFSQRNKIANFNKVTTVKNKTDPYLKVYVDQRV